MAENNITNVVDSFFKNMDSVVGTKTVVGEPTTVGDAIIIPLVDVSFAMAAGSGTRDKKSSGAGGMNAKMSPSAILIIQNGHARMISVKATDAISRITDLVPELIDKFKARKNVTVDKEAAMDAAFPEEDPVSEDMGDAEDTEE